MPDSHDLVLHQIQTGGTVDENRTPPVIRLHHPPVTHFGNAPAEYKAAHDSCALFDLSDRIQIEMSGQDARTFLQKFCTNDIQRLAAGDGCEAFITNIKGRILAHVFVFVTNDAVWIDSPPTDEEQLLAHFDRYIFNEAVQLHGRSGAFGDLYVAGDESVAQLIELGVPAGSLAKMQHIMSSIAGVRVAVRRIDFWDRPGFLISADRQQHVELWKQLVAKGIQPAGAQAFHTSRIESAFPIYGIDLSTDNLAQEAGRTEQAISFTKGCYLGQEPIARIDAIGHINRQVTRLRIETDTCLAGSAPITATDGAEVGTITSSMVVPGKPHSVALAILRTNHAQPGTSLTVQSDAGAVGAMTF